MVALNVGNIESVGTIDSYRTSTFYLGTAPPNAEAAEK